MRQVKVKDFTIDLLVSLTEILNKGNEATIKREKDNVVLVEVRRKALVKSEIKD